MFTRFAVWWAGGRAVRITPRHPRTIDELDALIFGGGADVDPKLYGQELLHVTAAKRKDEPAGRWLIGLVLFPLMWLARKLSACCVPKHGGRDDGRDALETTLLADAIERRL